MHPVRKHILQQLIFNPCLPFSKLKPKDVESNLFMYHLKQLMDEGLVQKRADGSYELTAEGVTFSDKLSLQSFKVRVQPKIITVIVCRNAQGLIVLYRKRRHPFLGLVGFPYGKIHLGEMIADGAKRELEEKANLQAELIHRGDVYLTVLKGKNLYNQSLCHIFETKLPKFKVNGNPLIGSCFWGELTDFKPEELIPGTADIDYLLQTTSQELFFKELTFSLTKNDQPALPKTPFP